MSVVISYRTSLRLNPFDNSFRSFINGIFTPNLNENQFLTLMFRHTRREGPHERHKKRKWTHHHIFISKILLTIKIYGYVYKVK